MKSILSGDVNGDGKADFEIGIVVILKSSSVGQISNTTM
jgi:hypothetical protein